jgi:hypothetical protein
MDSRSTPTLPPGDRLLSREDFRRFALLRDGGRCVVCGRPASEVHHILERRLFTEPEEEGGYFLSNSASVGSDHHRLAEQTLISPEALRAAAGISEVIVPIHLLEGLRDSGGTLTKWGDTELPDGRRYPGELFYDPSVQKILAEGGVLDRYILRWRYPRTYHVPFSPGLTKEERALPNLDDFIGQRVVVSRKVDGEGTTIMSDGYVHARSPESASHPSQSRVRALAAQVGPQLPAGWRICGENLQAKHAIHYHNLPAHFLLFSIWNERNEALSWDETLEWAQLLELPTVPVLYDGPFDEALLRELHQPRDERGDEAEGWVLRTAAGFPYAAFRTHVCKMVRSGHVPQHAQHWRRGPLIENELGDPESRR